MTKKLAYVTNTDSNDISLIDLENQKEIGRIPIGGSPRGAMAVDSNNSYGYVSNCAGNTVSKINLKNNIEETKIETGMAPRGLAIYKNLLFVSNSGSNDISIIDLNSDEEMARIPVGNNPRALSVTPNGKFLNVPCWGTDEIVSIEINYENPELSTVYSTIHLGKDAKPYHVFSDTNNKHLYTANTHKHSVSVIDLTKKEIIEDIPVGHGPRAVISDDERNLLYVTCEASNSVYIINKLTWSVANSVEVGPTPRGMKINDKTLYVTLFSRGNVVTNQLPNSLAVVDLDRQETDGYIRTGLGPCSMSIIDPIIEEQKLLVTKNNVMSK